MTTLEAVLAPISNYEVNNEDFEFTKEIGKGGYGVVYVGKHKSTGKQCAIKKLLIEQLDDQQTKYFAREVMVLAVSHDYFLLPFLGFSSKFPYLIVTEYISRGSLYDALKHKPGAPILEGTQKTIIALGVAHGMAYLHSKMIIHRDLKSLNILLDDDLYPKICDFGIARFLQSEEQLQTKNIGTPHWMAPELLMNSSYNHKVDVYAFGMLLWEMLTESIPFAGKDAFQIVCQVCSNGARPQFPSTAPVKLRNLIKMCWDSDPNKRPEFKQIFDIISTTRVFYKGTDENKIEEFVKQFPLNDGDNSSQRAPLNSEKPPAEEVHSDEEVVSNNISSYSSDIPAVLSKPRRKSDINVAKKKDNPFLEAPKSVRVRMENNMGKEDTIVKQQLSWDKIKNLFHNSLDGINVINAVGFFNDLFTLFEQRMPNSVAFSIMARIVHLLRTNHQYIDLFLKSDLFIYMQLMNPSLVEPNIQILVLLMERNINLLTKEHVSQLFNHAKTSPEKLVVFAYKFFQLGEKHRERETITRMILDYYILFIETEEGHKFLNIIFNYIYLPNPNVYAMKFKEICLFGLKQPSISVVNSSYYILNIIKNTNPAEIPYKYICKHITIAKTRNAAVAYLVQFDLDIWAPELISTLLSRINKSTLIKYIIIKYCTTLKGARLTLNHIKWDFTDSMTAFKLILAICHHIELIPPILKINEFPYILTDVIHHRKHVGHVLEFLKIMPITDDHIKLFCKTGFMKFFIQQTLGESDDELMLNGLTLMISFLEKVYDQAYFESIQYMIVLLQKGGRYKELAVVALNILVKQRESHNQMRLFKIEEFLPEVQLDNPYDEYRSFILERLEFTRLKHQCTPVTIKYDKKGEVILPL